MNMHTNMTYFYATLSIFLEKNSGIKLDIKKDQFHTAEGLATKAKANQVSNFISELVSSRSKIIT